MQNTRPTTLARAPGQFADSPPTWPREWPHASGLCRIPRGWPRGIWPGKDGLPSSSSSHNSEDRPDILSHALLGHITGPGRQHKSFCLDPPTQHGVWLLWPAFDSLRFALLPPFGPAIPEAPSVILPCVLPHSSSVHGSSSLKVPVILFIAFTATPPAIMSHTYSWHTTYPPCALSTAVLLSRSLLVRRINSSMSA
jgi:hypothetical protein